MNDKNFEELFLGEDYKIPTTSNYMRFQEGDNKFRVLSSAIVGFEYWNTKNKPIRSRECPDVIPEDIKIEKDGSTRVNHFWACIVWNYGESRIQILEITQKGIMKAIQTLVKNPKWGHPKGYDITITKTGSGFDTEYTTIADPHSPVDLKIADKHKNSKINLEALYEGADPFTVDL
jgi:hypothetical protein